MVIQAVEKAMASATCTIHNQSCVMLPQSVLDAAGLAVGAEVVIEASRGRIVIRPKRLTPITARIAAMELPVGDWPAMEDEIACEHR